MEEDYVSESFGLYEDQELIDALGMGRTPGQSLAPLVSEEAAQQESALTSTARGVRVVSEMLSRALSISPERGQLFCKTRCRSAM